MWEFNLPKIRLKRTNIIYNYSIAMGVLLLIGVFIGAAIINSAQTEEKNYFNYFIQGFLDSYQSTNTLYILTMSFFSSLLIQLVAFLFAFCCFGAPIIIIMPLIKGVFTGCVSAFLFLEMGAKGAFLNVLILWLPQALQAIFLIVFAGIALDTSITLFSANFFSVKQGIQAKFKRTVRVFIFTSLALLVTAALESGLTLLFAPVLIK